jgi:hypothetical protein
MHLLIPFASAMSNGARRSLREVKLPNLSRLLARLSATERVGIDEYTLTPPHERAWANALGWHAEDGCLPWAARAAALDRVDVQNKAWGALTPVHWHVGTDHISLADPRVLHLSAHESSAFFEAIRPLFESEGWTLAWGAPDRWYAAHDSLEGLPCASIDRVIGRNIDLWLPSRPEGKLIRRLQNEVQMLLYQQPANDHRVGLGALPVNSFWLSGCGRAQPERAVPDLVVDDRLKTSLLSENPVAWATAWQALDAGPIADALAHSKDGAAVAITLCGDRFAQRFDGTVARGAWARMTQTFKPFSVLPLLEAL